MPHEGRLTRDFVDDVAALAWADPLPAYVDARLRRDVAAATLQGARGIRDPPPIDPRRATTLA